ncbi:MAG: dihydroxyacetone kinase subunit DhaK [Candidatus Theseobacter exili]|nr:dihydroxyacetone kinase subunit DhaK [Candidatus Theseobacter exili]
MKKIINTPENVVDDMCRGFVLAHEKCVSLDSKYRIIYRKEINAKKVNLISGGGSGHEPSHAGFVGKGMLDGAVCGDVFASPSVMQIYNAITKLESDKGILLIVKNYTGDVMNFDGAAEMAEEDDDIHVEKVYVNDDVAVTDSLYTVGRRGVAGTVFVHKIAGAKAETGADLKDVKAVAEKVIANVRTMGFALTSCTVPAKGEPTFDIKDGDMEFGVGIHGEPGVSREKIVNAKELAKRVVGRIFEDMPVAKGADVAVLLNGLGGTPLQELYILYNEVSKILDKAGINIYFNMVGNYMTSLDMAGASVSILKLDDELKILLEAEADTPALKM